ncbi:MAG TPA: hypothetical protein VM802_07820 [Chitinophaga sp.]|uniref:tail fiber domain-containing protein n=1 Tax=Chitinophaga sp. TaxID=1869181 RepID=UPI002B6DC6FD|nr:hypothetical protein [Chitinophaga sp.]HVI44761.1 hypothetical protein [Chitinophaga sp.]
MSITTRAVLKAQFKSGAIPTSQDFINLIDSSLVRRDDAFFGKWVAGICYYEGDVVIYNNAFYTCTPAGDKPCGCESRDSKTSDPSKGVCSVDNPKKDCNNWKLIDVDATDDDWEIVRNSDKVPIAMYAKVFGKIGMGIQNPQARVHIHIDESQADFLFSPENATVPAFVIRHTEDEKEQWLSQHVTSARANFDTNTTGFRFNVEEQQSGEGEIAGEGLTEDTNPIFLTNTGHIARVGIGTDTPEAALDVHNENKIQVMVNPVASVIPQAVFIADDKYLATALLPTTACFITNAPDGFYFRKGQDDNKDYLANANNADTHTLLSVKPSGRVGIGTETPVTTVEVTKDGGGGAFLMCLDKINPGFSIINNRPNTDKRNYLLIGADNDWGAFLTDADKGFVFKRGGEYGGDNELEINQGEDLITISPEGKTVIGGLTPEGFELNVKGRACAQGLYLDTDVRKVKGPKPLGSVLANVKNLNPVTFTFNKKANCPTSEQQIGFLPHQVEDFFPELVSTDPDGVQSLAYANMVAVLTKALQEQQELIESMGKQITSLEKRIAALEGKK